MTRTAPIVDWSDPQDETVRVGLALTCECGAKPGEVCTAVCIDGKPLPNRLIHHFRLDKSMKTVKEDL